MTTTTGGAHGHVRYWARDGGVGVSCPYQGFFQNKNCLENKNVHILKIFKILKMLKILNPKKRKKKEKTKTQRTLKN
jgi:hypothetical protein